MANGIILISADVITPHSMQFTVEGSAGDEYEVTICDDCTCTCPSYHYNGRQCKHMRFILEDIIGIDTVANGLTDCELDEAVLENLAMMYECNENYHLGQYV